MAHISRNWFNFNQLQAASRTHNAAGFNSRINNIGSFILDPGVSSAFTFTYSSAGLVALTNAGNIRLSTVSGSYIYGDGAGANLPPTNATPDLILALESSNGRVEKLTPVQLAALLGIVAGDTTFFNDDLVQDANRIHDQAGFDTELHNVDLFVLDQGAGSFNNFRYGASGLTVNAVGATSVNFSVLDLGLVGATISGPGGSTEFTLTDSDITLDSSTGDYFIVTVPPTLPVAEDFLFRDTTTGGLLSNDFTDTAIKLQNVIVGAREVVEVDSGDSPISVAASDEIILADTTGGPIVINLPTAASAVTTGKSRVITIKVVSSTAGANSLTIEPAGVETIFSIGAAAGANIVSNAAGDIGNSWTIISSGTAWFVI